jgi:GxxExxY protein
MTTELIFKEESYKIIGACFEVYREKGCGFLEAVYQECLEIELRLQGVPFVPKSPLALEYKQCPLRAKYEPDFICYGKIILELKAVTELIEEHRAQVQNYLKATGFKLGLLVNFGHYPKVQLERIVAERGRYRFGGKRGSQPRNTRKTRKRAGKASPFLFLLFGVFGGLIGEEFRRAPAELRLPTMTSMGHKGSE